MSTRRASIDLNPTYTGQNVRAVRPTRMKNKMKLSHALTPAALYRTHSESLKCYEEFDTKS